MILVCGGAGYIGSHAVYQLLQSSFNVAVVDNLSIGHKEAVDNRASLFVGDLRERKFLGKVFENNKIEAVLHFAANALVGESMENPLMYYDNNVYGSQILLETMINHGVKNIVFSSTAATYGEPQSTPITENMPTQPTNPYGETKLSVEKMLKWCNHIHGIKYIVFRYFNVAGACKDTHIGEDHNIETHIIPNILFTALSKREFVPIYGDDYNTSDGTCVRDYIHVIDLVEAHILALRKLLENDTYSNTFNLGSKRGYTIKELIEKAEIVTNCKIPVEIYRRRKGDPAILIASSDKAREFLSWEPKNSDIETILQDAWNWHLSHPVGYKC